MHIPSIDPDELLELLYADHSEDIKAQVLAVLSEMNEISELAANISHATRSELIRVSRYSTDETEASETLTGVATKLHEMRLAQQRLFRELQTIAAKNQSRVLGEEGAPKTFLYGSANPRDSDILGAKKLHREEVKDCTFNNIKDRLRDAYIQVAKVVADSTVINIDVQPDPDKRAIPFKVGDKLFRQGRTSRLPKDMYANFNGTTVIITQRDEERRNTKSEVRLQIDNKGVITSVSTPRTKLETGLGSDVSWSVDRSYSDTELPTSTRSTDSASFSRRDRPAVAATRSSDDDSDASVNQDDVSAQDLIHAQRQAKQAARDSHKAKKSEPPVNRKRRRSRYPLGSDKRQRTASVSKTKDVSKDTDGATATKGDTAANKAPSLGRSR